VCHRIEEDKLVADAGENDEEDFVDMDYIRAIHSSHNNLCAVGVSSY